MANKKYQFQIGNRNVSVEADSEGVARYMVRLSEEGRARVRVGYLTGGNRTWLIEFFGNSPTQAHASAKAACRTLAEWALTQPAFLK